MDVRVLNEYWQARVLDLLKAEEAEFKGHYDNAHVRYESHLARQIDVN